MSTPPSPVRSFLGGLLLIPPVHALLLFNQSIFGISGFLHRAVRPKLYRKGAGWEALAGVSGLILGGGVVGWLEGLSKGGASSRGSVSSRAFAAVVFNGLLVGLGTKLANGCTSGHMISGLTRLSPRSMVATASFFLFGGTVASLLRTGSSLPALSPSSSWDWSVGELGWGLIAGWVVLGGLAYTIALATIPRSVKAKENDVPSIPRQTTLVRSTLTFLLSAQFALALHLSSLTSSAKVLTFLDISSNFSTWDPSLAFLALGALPFSIILFRTFTRHRLPAGAVPSSQADARWRDPRLLVGAAMFGIGWGMMGICPGPVLANVGSAGSWEERKELATWLAGVVVGGLAV